jgi:hypothetical protein
MINLPRKMKKIFSYLLTIFSFLGCKNGETAAQSKLPAQRPADLKIEIYEGGGMLPQSESLFISADSCYYQYSFSQAENKVYFTMTAQELDKLYSQLLDNQLDRIKTENRGKVYDRCGERISLTFNGYKNSFSLNNSGGNFIAKNWLANYKKCLQILTDLREQKLNALKIPFTIEFDKSILTAGKLIYVQIADANFSYQSENMGLKPSLALAILAGEHNLSIHLSENTQPSYQRKNFASTHFNFKINPPQTTLILKLVAKELKWEIK